MATLGKSELLKRLKKKPPLIENVEESQVGGAGIDLRAKTFYQLVSSAELSGEHRKLPKVEEIKGGKVILRPGEYVLVETIEKLNTHPDLMALMLNRSTLFRCGVSLRTAVIDPGYVGTLTFGMKNESARAFIIRKGARIGQVVFFEVKGKAELYRGRYQGGNVT
jgi:dUTP pyrophosphatase